MTNIKEMPFGMCSFDRKEFKKRIEETSLTMFRKTIENCSMQQKYLVVCAVTREWIMPIWMESHKKIEEHDAKRLYYFSMEFLEGRALGNNLLSISKDEEVREALSELDIDLNALEDEERDPALGNGGLGRLAACFLDSLATLSYPAYGCGIRYKYGLFRQKIVDGFQAEVPDNWLKNGYPFEMRRYNYTCEVKFGGYVETLWDGNRNYFVQKGYQVVMAVPYDIPIVGYNNGFVNTLRVWDAEPVQYFDLEAFDKGRYREASLQAELADNIVDVLYPNDNHVEGKELRLRQQYFFVSASVQAAIKKYRKCHSDIHGLPEKAVFHMNDTHPSLVVAELMRILLDEYKLEWDDAFDIVRKTCAFTNHTIMQEALEKWPADIFQKLLPRIFQIVMEMNRRLQEDISGKYGNDLEKFKNLSIIFDGNVRMANLAIYGSRSVNGVAKIHSDILKKLTFKDFYELYPERFGNKTNGVTQRRFLLKANPLLADFISKRIGTGWITDLSELKKLEAFADDEESLNELSKIKYQNKLRLAEYIKKHNKIDVDPDSIFDVQVKRLHEYKRQLMNILRIMAEYDRLKKDESFDMLPRTYIFGAKAAPGYYRAKLIIKLINAVADVINNDESINGKIKVVFIEDYSVSNAEIIFPAADVSEQISTASKEASGTSNMKFMMNGALTVGTLDGANIEIVNEAGAENEFIFGMTAEEVMEHEERNDYDPMTIFNTDSEIRHTLMQLINGTYSPDDPERFRDIFNSLVTRKDSFDKPDTYFILQDMRDFMRAQSEVDRKYRDKKSWTRSALLNIAGSGKFSSDRTIEEYVRDIWHIEKVK